MNKKESSRFKLDVDDLFPDLPSNSKTTTSANKPMNMPKSSVSPNNSLPIFPDYVPDKNSLKINNKEKSEELKDSNPFSFFKVCPLIFIYSRQY